MRRLTAVALLVTGSFIPAGVAARGASLQSPANVTYAVQPGDIVSFGCTSTAGQSGASSFTFVDASGTRRWPAASEDMAASSPVRLAPADSSIGWHRFIKISEPGVFTGTWTGSQICSADLR